MIDVQNMFPVMVVNDLEGIKAFYQTIFGFQVVFYEPCFYLHLLSPNGVQLGFLVPNHPSQPEFLHPVMNSHGYLISLEVADASKAYQTAQHIQLAIAMELKDESWGQRHFMLQDPAGIKVDIVEHLNN